MWEKLSSPLVEAGFRMIAVETIYNAVHFVRIKLNGHQTLLDPSNTAVALERAVALHRLGRTEEASSCYTQVIRL